MREKDILALLTNIERLLTEMSVVQNNINSLVARINAVVTTLQSEAGDVSAVDLTEATSSVEALEEAANALVGPAVDPAAPADPASPAAPVAPATEPVATEPTTEPVAETEPTVGG